MKKILRGIRADDFRHPLDCQATNNLKQIPGLDLMVRSLLGSLAGDFFYLNNIASSIKISDKQLPELYELLLDACKILDLEPPQLYIQQNPVPNAYTLAMRGEKPFIVLHTSLVEMLTPPEIQAVIAHELGHLKCEHGVYLTLANLMVLAVGLLPAWGTVIAQSLQTQMLEWLRCAEFTCDRSALLVAQDPKIVMSVLMKLAGGSPKLAPQLNLDAFIEQARAYDTISDTELGRMLKSLQISQLTHPVPVIRAREIDLWARSSTYERLLNGEQICYNSPNSKNKGGWRNW